jgi:hypothetical protein
MSLLAIGLAYIGVDLLIQVTERVDSNDGGYWAAWRGLLGTVLVFTAGYILGGV